MYYVKKDKFVPGHTMKHIQGVGVYFCPFVTSTLDGDESATSRPGRFTPTRVINNFVS